MFDQLMGVISHSSHVVCLRLGAGASLGSIIHIHLSMLIEGAFLASVSGANAQALIPTPILSRKELDLTKSHSRLHVKMIFIDLLFILG